MKIGFLSALVLLWAASSSAQTAEFETACATAPVAGECVVTVGDIVSFQLRPETLVKSTISWEDGSPAEVWMTPLATHAYATPGTYKPSAQIQGLSWYRVVNASPSIRVTSTAAIPTLGEFGMAALVLLLAIIGTIKIRDLEKQ